MAANEVEYYLPGDLIYEGKDFAHVIYHRFRNQYCDYCCIRNPSVKLCAYCHYVGYCNKKCQKLAWPEHKLECKILYRLHNFPPIEVDSVLLFARVLARLQKEGGICSEYVGSERVVFCDAMKFTTCFGFISWHDVKLHYVPNLYCMLLKYLADTEVAVNLIPEYEISLLSKVLTDKGMLFRDREYGMFFCVGRSFFKRSCLPNAMDFLGKNLTHEIRATKKFPKGDLNNVHLPCMNMIEYFCLDCASAAKAIHMQNLCQSCKSNDSPVSGIVQKSRAHKIIAEVNKLVEELVVVTEAGDGVRERVDSALRDVRGVLFDTHLLRLKLLIWKIFINYKKDLFTVKRFERSLIHLVKTLHGDQSFELFTIYHCLSGIYTEHGKFKTANDYFAKRDEIGGVYGIAPLTCELDEILGAKNIMKEFFARLGDM